MLAMTRVFAITCERSRLNPWLKGLFWLSRSGESVDFVGKRGVTGVGGLTLALGSDDDGSAGGQGGRDSHEGETISTSLFGLTEVDYSDGILTVVDGRRKLGAEGGQFHRVEIAYENGILHGPTETLHDFMNLAKSFAVSYIVCQ